MSSNDHEENKWGKLELVSPQQIEAGELACITLRYIAGTIGVARGGTQWHLTQSLGRVRVGPLGRRCRLKMSVDTEKTSLDRSPPA